MYLILLQSEKVDYTLMETVFLDENNTQYISFEEIDIDVKLGLLDFNNMKNSDKKYKVLEELNVN